MTLLEEFREFLDAMTEDCDCMPSACFGIDRTRAAELLSRLEAELKALDDRRTVEGWALSAPGRDARATLRMDGAVGSSVLRLSSADSGRIYSHPTSLDEAYAKAAEWVRKQGA